MVDPDARFRPSFAAAMDELRAQGRGAADDFVDRIRAVTCDVEDIGSRTVIARNGGVLEDERQGRLRFWVSMAGSS